MLRALLFVVLVMTCHLVGQAQPETYNWVFGRRASVVFPAGGSPVATAVNQIDFNEACATISDSTGQLLFFCNGEVVCDRMGAIMPNGRLVGGNTSASQGALLLPAPSQPGFYFLFTVPANGFNVGQGLRYSIINRSLRGGLGDVVAGANSIPVPLPPGCPLVTERLAAVRHANGRDF